MNRPFQHQFPALELPADPWRWVAWNICAAADRLDEAAFQVTLVRPLRWDKHVTLPGEAIMAAVATSRFEDLTPIERMRAVDDLDEHAEEAPDEARLAAEGLWRAALHAPELQLTLLRKLAAGLTGKGPPTPVLAATFDTFASHPPANRSDLCLMLEGMRDLVGESLSGTILRDYIVAELDLDNGL